MLHMQRHNFSQLKWRPVYEPKAREKVYLLPFFCVDFSPFASSAILDSFWFSAPTSACLACLFFFFFFPAFFTDDGVVVFRGLRYYVWRENADRAGVSAGQGEARHLLGGGEGAALVFLAQLGVRVELARTVSSRAAARKHTFSFMNRRECTLSMFDCVSCRCFDGIDVCMQSLDYSLCPETPKPLA